MGSVASMQAESAMEQKKLPCSDPAADAVRVIAYPDTPMYQRASTGSAIIMQLSAGVRVSVYSTSGQFTAVCNDHAKAWIKTDRLGRISSKQ
jgi:SH3-like domain-containing protein